MKESFNFKAWTNFYKGDAELVNPHEAYDYQDLALLIDELKKKAFSYIPNNNCSDDQGQSNSRRSLREQAQSGIPVRDPAFEKR